jgi:hypothetical protein
MGFGALGVPFVSKGLQGDPAKTRAGFFAGFGRDLWDPAVIFVFGIFLLGNVLALHYFVDSVSRMLRFFFGV